MELKIPSNREPPLDSRHSAIAKRPIYPPAYGNPPTICKGIVVTKSLDFTSSPFRSVHSFPRRPQLAKARRSKTHFPFLLLFSVGGGGGPDPCGSPITLEGRRRRRWCTTRCMWARSWTASPTCSPGAAATIPTSPTTSRSVFPLPRWLDRLRFLPSWLRTALMWDWLV